MKATLNFEGITVERRKKLAAILLACAVVVLLVWGCSSEEEAASLHFEGETVPVELEIDCSANLMFSRYDLEVLVEDVKIGLLGHGAKDVFLVDLPIGEYSLTLQEEGNAKVKGTVRFKVEGAGLLHFEASCNRDRVNLEQKFPELEAAQAAAEQEEREKREAEEKAKREQEEAERQAQEEKKAEEEAARKAEEEAALQKQKDEEAQLEALSGKGVDKFLEACEALGYTYQMDHYETEADFTDYFEGNDLDNPKKWKIVEIEEIDTEAKKVWALIGNKEMMKQKKKEASAKEKLEEKLPAIFAWQAADAYGESVYPYGFKLHYIMDNMAEEPRDGDTWFLKAGCDVKNEYGTWQKGLVCEALVSGTEENPVVESFNVY